MKHSDIIIIDEFMRIPQSIYDEIANIQNKLTVFEIKTQGPPPAIYKETKKAQWKQEVNRHRRNK